MSLLDVSAKLFREPIGAFSYLMVAPMTLEPAVGWLIIIAAGMVTLGFFVWILLKIVGR